MPNPKNIQEAIGRLKNDIENEAITCKYIGTTVVRTKDLHLLVEKYEAITKNCQEVVSFLVLPEHMRKEKLVVWGLEGKTPLSDFIYAVEQAV